MTFTDEEGNPGHGMDGKNLIEDWKNLPGGKRTYLWNKKQLTQLDVANSDHVMGLFGTNHCSYQLDINDEGLEDEKPSLADMVDKAIDILSKNSDWCFLFVEGGRIDLAHHDNLPKYSLEETVQFTRAIEVATKKLDSADTLFVVTADHSHALSYAGYAKRGNDILSTTDDVAEDNMKYMTLSYGNGQGYYGNFNQTNGQRVDPESFVKSSKVLKYPGTVPLVDETHGGDDVVIYALGPYAHLFQGTIEQNIIPHIMAYAACIGDGITACK
jgi:alkaline phosphatase